MLLLVVVIMDLFPRAHTYAHAQTHAHFKGEKAHSLFDIVVAHIGGISIQVKSRISNNAKLIFQTEKWKDMLSKTYKIDAI